MNKSRQPESHSKRDAYELPAEYPLDPRKMQPNRFAGKPKHAQGGKRAGAGRKSAPQPIERHTITLYKTHAIFLRRLDSNLSRAIRKLITRVR